MKKFTILFLLSIVSIANGYSQCSKTYAGTGVYPTQLADAFELVQYTQEIDFTIPADTVYMTQNIHIDSMKVKAVYGFPGTNFNYSCGITSCLYVPNASNKFQGCFTIKGVAPKGSAGSYKIHVELDGYIQTPFGAQVYTIEDSSVNFMIGVCSIKTGISTLDSSLCDRDTTSLTAFGNGKFNWFKNNIKLSDSIASIQVTTSGDYRAVLIDTTGCTDSSRTITINVSLPLTKPTVKNIGIARLVCNTKGKNYIWKYNGVIDTTYNGKDTIISGPNGYYQCSYQDSNGCWSMFSDSTSNSGIWSINSTYQAAIQPNPSNGIFNLMIQNNQFDKFMIQIVDMKGAVTEKIYIQGKELNIPINLSHYSNGIYTILISGENGSSVLKTVVSH